MKYLIRITLIGFLLVALLGLPTITYASVSQDDIGASLAQPDGSEAVISNVEIIWAGKSGRSFAIKESGEPQPPAEHPRLVVVSTLTLPVSSHWNCDVSGVLSTYSGVSRRDGRPYIQRVLIVSPENVAIYCSPKGRPILFPPPKSLGIDWPHKRTLAELASERGATAGVMTMEEEEPLPPLPDSPYSSIPANYCATIADARAQYSPTARVMVELQCRPFSGATSSQFDLEEDGSADDISVFFSGSSGLPDGRINKLVGTIQKNEYDEYWIEVDSGPNWQAEDVEGRAQAIPAESAITYARTFEDGEEVTLTGQIISADRSDFPNAIYVQDPNRAAGIRVLYTGTLQLERGDEVDVSGIIGTGDDLEREIDAGTTGITYVDDPGEPAPVGMNNRSLGGGDFNVFTPGVNWPYGSGTGLYNKGLLVKSWGRVTAVDADNKCFYVDDGTGFNDGSGNIGVKVSWDWPTAGKPSILPPLEGWYVSVTGIGGSEDFGSQRIIRVLRPRDQNDVVIHQAGAPTVYDPVDAWQEEFTPSDSSDAGGTGPSSADSVDLATGAYNNDPDPDIVAVNPFGPDVEFTRLYRSKLAESGVGSAGLSVGWTHNYDAKIVRDEAGWGDLRLVFPDGAADTLRPVIDGGTPTGEFVPMGPSYLVTGEPSGTPGLWNWIRIMFPDETKWEFTSASGSPYRLRKLSDIQGNNIYVNRNVDTSISSVSTDPTGTNKLLDFSYVSGSLTISDVPSSRSVTLSFVTEAGATVLKSVSQVDSADLKWRYTYEEIGGIAYLTQVEVPDPTGELTYRGHPIIYDGEGRVQEIKDANNNSRSYVYGQGYTQVYVKDPNGVVAECWTQKIGASKEDLGVIDANGKETTIEYNAAKRPWRFTNKNAKQSTAVYDGYGNITQVTNESGIVTTYGYTDPASPFRLTSVQTSAGGSTKTSTTLEYYANGLLRYVNSPKPNTSGTSERVTTTYTYTSAGNVQTITTPPGLGTDGNPDIREVTTTVYEYQQDTSYSYSTTEKPGQPIVISTYEGDSSSGKLLTRTHMRYDSRGRLIEAIDPLIGSPPDPGDYYLRHRTTIAYNNEDQITDIWYAPTGANVNERVHRVYSYNYPGGELTSIELYSEAGSLFRTVEMVSGKESELKEVLGNTLETNHAYDALYRLNQVADINNHTTSFGHDAVGNVSGMLYPGSQLYQWQYDADHNLSRRIDALGRTTNYGYDSTKSYLTSIDYPTGTDVSLTYDAFGRVGSVTDATGTVSYTYDDSDLVMSVTTDYAGSVPSKTITYAYNPDGSRRSMSVDGVSAPFNYWYAYNANPGPGLAVTVSNPGIGTPVRCYYNLKGQLIRQTAPRLQTDYTYDNRGLRTSVHNWATLPNPDVTGSRFYNMQYDPAGNLLQASITIPSVGSAAARSGVVYYDYDGYDRLIYEGRTISGGADLYEVWFDYDGADNITEVRDLYFNNYNSNNQIVGAGYSYDANGNAIDYREFGFGYDYEDLPAEIIGGRNGTFSMAFRSDGLRAWRHTSTWGYDYFLYDGDRVVAEFKGDGSTSWYYNYGSNGLAMRSSAPSTYYVYSFDHLGSLAQRFYSGTGDGLAQKTVVYDAYGKLWWDQMSSGSMFATPDPPGFAGQWGAYTDHETRPTSENTPLVLMGIRYYDPVTARFVTRDPALGVNDYAYCGNNPVGRVDADGEILETIADIASIGWSTYDLIKNPSWANVGYLAWDVGATVVPFAPGSYVAKGAKIATKGIKAAKGAKAAKAVSKGVRAAKDGKKPISKAYHYTRAASADKIMAKHSRGLKSSSGTIFATPNKGLSPLQAQLDLALPPNRGLSDAILEIDLDGLRRAGIDIGDPGKVGRSFNMPGGGLEMLIHTKTLPKRFLKRIR